MPSSQLRDRTLTTLHVNKRHPNNEWVVSVFTREPDISTMNMNVSGYISAVFFVFFLVP